MRYQCSKCKKTLTKVFPELSRRRTDPLQFRDALNITFSGGYGMYVDNKPVTVTLCRQCANDLLNANPWMDQVLEDSLL